MKHGIIIIFFFFLLTACTVQAQQNPTVPLPSITVDVGSSDNADDIASTIELLALLTVLALAPSILIMTTSYLRIIIVLHFLRQALGTMQQPPTQLLAGFALFVTFFIMSPTWSEVYDEAIKPMMDEEITADSAYTIGIEPIRTFMFKHARDEDIEIFLSISTDERPATREDLPTHVLIPAFIMSELRAAFIIGFFLFVPFLVIDLIVASILMAMGMMMLPPIMISLPFKILLFILVDGWSLMVGSLMRSFY